MCYTVYIYAGGVRLFCFHLWVVRGGARLRFSRRERIETQASNFGAHGRIETLLTPPKLHPPAVDPSGRASPKPSGKRLRSSTQQMHYCCTKTVPVLESIWHTCTQCPGYLKYFFVDMGAKFRMKYNATQRDAKYFEQKRKKRAYQAKIILILSAA